MIIFISRIHCNRLGGVSLLNKKAAFFASMVIVVIALLSGIYVLFSFGLKASMIIFIAAIVWVIIGFYFKNSKSA